MAQESFDDLLQALQASLAAAQHALLWKREEALRRLYQTDEAGNAARSPFFVFDIPQAGMGKGDRHEMQSLPLSSFRSHRSQRISRLSLEFECALEMKRCAAGPVYALAIRPPKKSWWSRETRLHMQIVFQGSEPPVGEVQLAGRTLMEIPPCGAVAAGSPPPAVRLPWLRAYLEQLRGIWAPRQFLMSAEQSARVSEILGELTAANSGASENREFGVAPLQ
jgi:hypothetical protein